MRRGVHVCVLLSPILAIGGFGGATPSLIGCAALTEPLPHGETRGEPERPPGDDPPSVRVPPPATTGRDSPPAGPPPTPREGPAGPPQACEEGYVEVLSGDTTTRFTQGRTSAWNRGATYAHAELVVHPTRTVLAIEALERADLSAGGIAITLTSFAPPQFLPAAFQEGKVELRTSEGDERTMTSPMVVVYAFGGKGQWVDGAFYAVTGTTSTVGPGGQPTPAFSGTFHVCRTVDWVSEK